MTVELEEKEAATETQTDDSVDQNAIWDKLAETDPEKADLLRRHFVPKSEFTRATQQAAANQTQINQLAQQVAYLQGQQTAGTPAQKKREVDAFLEENAGDDPATLKIIRSMADSIKKELLGELAPVLNPVIANTNMVQADQHIESYRDTFVEKFGEKGGKRFNDVKRRMIDGFRSTGVWQTPEQVFDANWPNEYLAARNAVVDKTKQKKKADDAEILEGFQGVRSATAFPNGKGKNAGEKESLEDVIRRNAKKCGLAL